MAFGFFKKKNENGEATSDSSAMVPAFKRDPRKAAPWFKHAAHAADTRNYDYAIECYISGLRFEPDKLAIHEALRDAALKRKVSGGKPVGFAEKFKSSGKTDLDKFLQTEMFWSKDPLNHTLAVEVMERAMDSHRPDQDLDLSQVVNWLGGIVLDSSQSTKKPSKSMYVKTCDILEAVGAYDYAIQACRHALLQAPDDSNLLQKLKDLEAERTMATGGYGQAGKEGGFRTMVKNLDKQKELDQEDNLSRTESAMDQQITRRRAEFDEDPRDVSRLNRLVEALDNRGTDEAQNEAIKLLREAWEQTGQYHFKVRSGDIQMRQYRRHLLALKAKIDANPNDTEARKAYAELAHKRQKFELEEYTERAKNYPTDMGLKFELGRRLYLEKRLEDAIASLQEAQADPKQRVRALQYLGLCYLAKGWFDEAVATLKRGIEIHPVNSDALGLEIRYLLMDALSNSAAKSKNLEQAREAMQVASEIVQININFRDIRSRLEKIRAVVEELSKSQA